MHLFFLPLLFFTTCQLAEAQGQCTTPQSLYNCYISYLGKYGVVPDEGYLPTSDFLLSQMSTHGLPVICKDFDELTACLGAASTYCVNFNTFYAYVNGRNAQAEALAYLQNHAFFEFACGAGKELFMQNLDCLQRNFQQIPLTNRMKSCGQSGLYLDQEICPSTLDVTACVHREVAKACGRSAGAAACGAAANIERRLDFLDAACLTEMDARCSVCAVRTMTSFLIFLFVQNFL